MLKSLLFTLGFSIIIFSINAQAIDCTSCRVTGDNGYFHGCAPDDSNSQSSAQKALSRAMEKCQQAGSKRCDLDNGGFGCSLYTNCDRPDIFAQECRTP